MKYFFKLSTQDPSQKKLSNILGLKPIDLKKFLEEKKKYRTDSSFLESIVDEADRLVRKKAAVVNSKGYYFFSKDENGLFYLREASESEKFWLKIKTFFGRYTEKINGERLIPKKSNLNFDL